MPFRTLMKFRNLDVTSDVNRRLQNLVQKGVFFGGDVVPVAGALQVQVQPLGAMGSDGMVTLLESAPEVVAVTPNATQRVLLHAEYVANDDAVAELEVLTEAAYGALSAAQKAARVTLAVVDVPLGAVEVDGDDISRVDADVVDPHGRSAFRGVVAAETDLPDYTAPATGLTTQNRPDDIYFVSDERIFYHWNTAATPQWTPVISAATELALQQHKLNQDDGTDPPDFIDAQHVLVKHRQSLDDGTASIKAFGGSGTDFGVGNALVDEQYPAVRRVRGVVSGLISAVDFQITGQVYCGTGVLGTAEQYVRLATSGQQTTLKSAAADQNPITVLQVRDATNTFQITPSVQADALGFVTNPWIRMDFSLTSASSYSGALDVLYGVRAPLGTVTPAQDFPAADGLIEPARNIAASPANWLAISGSTVDVQTALEELDVVANGVFRLMLSDSRVRTVGPAGSNASFTGADQVPFQSAADALGALSQKGGVVVVLPGTYSFTDDVVLTDGTHDNITFMGLARQHRAADGGAPDCAKIQQAGTGVSDGFFSVGARGVTFRNLRFENEQAAVAKTHGMLHFTIGTVEPDFEGPTIQGCAFISSISQQVAVVLQGAAGNYSNVTIQDCFFERFDNAATIPTTATGGIRGTCIVENAKRLRVADNTFGTRDTATFPADLVVRYTNVPAPEQVLVSIERNVHEPGGFGSVGIVDLRVPGVATSLPGTVAGRTGCHITRNNYELIEGAGATVLRLGNTSDEGAVYWVRDNVITTTNCTILDATGASHLWFVDNVVDGQLGSSAFSAAATIDHLVVAGNEMRLNDTMTLMGAASVVYERNRWTVESDQQITATLTFPSGAHVLHNRFIRKLQQNAASADSFVVALGTGCTARGNVFDSTDTRLVAGADNWLEVSTGCVVDGNRFLGQTADASSMPIRAVVAVDANLTDVVISNNFIDRFGFAFTAPGASDTWTAARNIRVAGNHLVNCVGIASLPPRSMCLGNHLDCRDVGDHDTFGFVNRRFGVLVEDESIVADNVLQSNAVASVDTSPRIAISIGQRCVVRGNVIRGLDNISNAIAHSTGGDDNAVIVGNMVFDCASQSTNVGPDGIAAQQSAVIGNYVASFGNVTNLSALINSSNECAVVGNVVNGVSGQNSPSIDVSGLNDVAIGNVIDGTATAISASVTAIVNTSDASGDYNQDL